MQHFDQTVGRLSYFLRGEAPSAAVLSYLAQVAVTDAKEDGRRDPANYPRGWARRVGVWSEYFSESNVRVYNKVVRATSRPAIPLHPLWPRFIPISSSAGPWS